MLPKVVCLAPTYGRFSLIQRSISFFLNQTYPNKEMVVFNQSPVPLVGDFPGVKIINTTQKFSGLGAIYTAALEHCEGDLINMWDDDNGAFPWLLEETIQHKERKAAKSEQSWIWHRNAQGVHFLHTAQNILEPSIVFDMNVIRDIGFTNTKSFVHTNWYYWLVNHNELQMIPRSQMVPGLVYCWGEEGIGNWHISCQSDEEKGFNLYRERSTDFGDGQLKRVDLTPWYRKITKDHPELQQRLGLAVTRA